MSQILTATFGGGEVVAYFIGGIEARNLARRVSWSPLLVAWCVSLAPAFSGPFFYGEERRYELHLCEIGNSFIDAFPLKLRLAAVIILGRGTSSLQVTIL